MSDQGKNILRSFLWRLTSLSGSNRGLLLLRLTVDHFVDLHSVGFLTGQKSFEIIRALIRNSGMRVCAIHDSRVEANNTISEKLKLLQRGDRFLFEEKGTNDLHVGWPFVKGKFSDGTLVRCPLLYFPVTLVQEGAHWVLEPRTDAGITFNKAFLLAYAFYHKIKLDEDLLDFSFEDFEKEARPFITQLYELLNDRIELNFNSQNFTEEISAFRQYKRIEFEEEHKLGELKLHPEAVLGLFPQTSSQLVPDYLKLLEDDTFSDLESFFTREDLHGDDASLDAHTSNAPVREENLFTPFPLDVWQENSIHMVKQGKSVVVQGPPGTGKSQLICNLLADSIAAGKRALLVCQKRAALDVVYHRMKDIGLAPFLGLVHDYRNDRKEIFGKIATQIDKIDEYKERNRSVDVIQLERRFFHVSRSIDRITEELQEFHEALFQDTECGLSAKQMYLSSDAHAEGISMKQEYHHFRFPVDEFLRTINRYCRYAATLETADNPWRERKSFSQLTAADQREVEKTIREVSEYQKHVAEQIFRLIGLKINLDDAATLYDRGTEMEEMLSRLSDDTVYRFFQAMVNEDEDETSLLWVSNMERVTLNCYDDVGPEVSVPTERLGEIQKALHERMKSRRNLFKMIRWELFSEKKFLIKRVLVANDLAYNKYGLRVLEQKIDSRLNLEHHFTALKARTWLADFPNDYKKDKLQKWFDAQKEAIRSKTIYRSLREIHQYIGVPSLSKSEFRNLIAGIMAVIEDVPARKNSWLRYLSPFQLRHLIPDPAYGDILLNALRNDFENLCTYDRLKESLSQAEQSVIQKLREHIGRWDGNEFQRVFENSLRLAWIDHIEMKYPSLRMVSSHGMEERQKELQELVNEKQKISLEITLLRAREHSYDGLTYNRLNNLVTFRDIHHQVTKKKKLWPLRKVISSFHGELFQLLPCWLASPESVSALFPMETLFDIVIFDEASQCFSERGIPAMYRGKQILVAGDSQQLRPSDLYQVRWMGDEEEETADAEVESLLELSERYLPTVRLNGHYRSKSPALIEFSNRHFYHGLLRMLPDRLYLNASQPAIEYLKVDGIWENQTNAVEASFVTEKVLELLQSDSRKEIGIVTFNAPQQNLIMDLLEERLGALPESVFVKNIENVQGDEKDVIIFSIGYAPDKKGRMSLLFGSLNQAGGENRLNVAVTRSREKIIVVTSILPQQLNTEETKNAGPKLLRSYLDYAYAVSSGVALTNNGASGTANRNEGLAKKLAQWGVERLPGFQFELHTLPYADVSVRDDENYLGVLLTDDERFERNLSVKDSFAYTPELLQRKNWKYRFVFTRQYWREAPQLEQSLMLFIGKGS